MSLRERCILVIGLILSRFKQLLSGKIIAGASGQLPLEGGEASPVQEASDKRLHPDDLKNVIGSEVSQVALFI